MSPNCDPLESVLRAANELGLNLSAERGKLLVSPASRLPAQLRAALIRHKSELLRRLDGSCHERSAEAVSWPRCHGTMPWLHIAKQILAGEFDGANRSTVESLIIGLRNIGHPLCRRVLERLGVSDD